MLFNANAQVVNIPDTELKNFLINSTAADGNASVNTPTLDSSDGTWYVSNYHSIDINGDGQIQLSEAQAIKFLKLTGIYCLNTTGLEAFTNLQYLDFSNNFPLTSLDVTPLINLKGLVCGSNNYLTSLNASGLSNLLSLNCLGNSLSSLNITGSTNLQILHCNYNELTSLNVSQHINLKELSCEFNNINTLNITNLINLKTVNCDSNNLTNLNVNNLINLQYLNLNNNQISSINLSQNINLKEFICSDNLLTTLNLSGLTNLKEVDCGLNQITNLNISGLVNLQILKCSNNLLSNLDLTGIVNLTDLKCTSNQLSSLNVSGLSLLVVINCSFNLLTTLDLSSNPILADLTCKNNLLTTLDVTNNKDLFILDCSSNQLQTLFIKNNPLYQNLYFTFNNNPNLHYICTNDFHTPVIQQLVSDYGYSTTCQVNSYCTFNPGGTFYTIQGNNRYDGNNNGCDTNDINYPNLKYNITSGTTSGTFISNPSGNYSIPVSAGTHTFTPQLENPTYFTISPTTANVTFPATASPFTQNFCLTANGVRHDLEVVIIPINPARPGFDATYKLKYKNKGNQTENATLVFNYNDTVLDLITTSVNPTVQNTGILNWNLGTLNPLQQGEILITLNLNSPTETPALNSGDILNYSSSINGLNTDEVPIDNTSALNQIVVNSYDPNDKRCLEGTTINPSMIGQYVHYMIRFENTGTFPAENIVVKDMIDLSKFDISTLQMTDASNSCYTRINGNKVEFIFENINLDFNDATNDGYVVFKIKTKSTLTIGSQITNNANIYFDYNFPIVTNTATSTFQVLSTDNFNFENYFIVFPNPAKDILNIKAKQEIEISSVTIYTMLGQIIQTIMQPSNTINVSDLKTGNYFLKVTTEKGTSTTKFIKD